MNELIAASRAASGESGSDTGPASGFKEGSVNGMLQPSDAPCPGYRGSVGKPRMGNVISYWNGLPSVTGFGQPGSENGKPNLRTDGLCPSGGRGVKPYSRRVRQKSDRLLTQVARPPGIARGVRLLALAEDRFKSYPTHWGREPPGLTINLRYPGGVSPPVRAWGLGLSPRGIFPQITSQSAFRWPGASAPGLIPLAQPSGWGFDSLRVPMGRRRRRPEWDKGSGGLGVSSELAEVIEERIGNVGMVCQSCNHTNSKNADKCRKCGHGGLRRKNKDFQDA